MVFLPESGVIVLQVEDVGNLANKLAVEPFDSLREGAYFSKVSDIFCDAV